MTLLISDTNSTAYPTLIYGLYLPYGPGVGLRGLGWRFLSNIHSFLKNVPPNIICFAITKRYNNNLLLYPGKRLAKQCFIQLPSYLDCSKSLLR